LARASQGSRPHPALEVDSSLEVAHGPVVAPDGARESAERAGDRAEVASIGATV
jgi:hypothetical protein